MMELQILAYACRTSCARNVVGVIPYLPYSKQSKMRKRGSIVCKLLAKMLSKSGTDHYSYFSFKEEETHTTVCLNCVIVHLSIFFAKLNSQIEFYKINHSICTKINYWSYKHGLLFNVCSLS